MGIMKVHNCVPCKSSLMSKEDVSYKLWREAIGKTPPLRDGQEEYGLALAGCGMGKVIVQGELSRQGEYR
jgi:hypothetical protein